MKSKNKKAVFFDRDNTLIKDEGYTYKKKDLKFLPGVIEGLKYLVKKDYLIIVITNQSGIARNYFKLRDVKIFHNYMNYKLKNFGAKIDDFFICGCHPNFPKINSKCKCRKPSNTMILSAIKKWRLKKENIFMIGDKRSDKTAALKTNLRFYYKSKKINLYKQLRKLTNY